ncbi:membrane protein FAM174B [Corythoichthys intestinalis]|uniref:membrane protein FAM174B n=1 Tax=Corythoichthys intestinalis TaxID=161448 RepID=UPI0025A4E459|nr:membrane protein FAM174B [Corythoichthys intestinalis]XP_057693708.1 membrane protein FAM174B [Corythoichthys intestinalis]
MAIFHLALSLMAAAVWSVEGEPRSLSTSPAEPLNTTSVILREHDGGGGNGTHDAVGAPTSFLMTHLPTLKVVVIFTCVLTGALITCLLAKVVRSGRRLRKTRKYDIITTPAERVEMAPLNDENEDEDDSTLFDVNYR